MLGNKAVARGLYEAGCCVISSYPGTPSTEITEEAALYPEIYCEWAPNEKVAMEDMCQLTERQTEDKYKSSYERVAKAIVQYSSMPKMDVTNFFESVLFSWITGNNDMHLKNFSLYEPIDGTMRLTPAYDMLNAVILNPKDDEELALTLNGKKRKLKRSDFITSGMVMGVEQKTIERFIQKYVKLLPKTKEIIDQSFLNAELKDKYWGLVRERINRLNKA